MRDFPYLILDSDPERDPRLGLAISRAESCEINAAAVEALCARIVATASARGLGGGGGPNCKGSSVSSRSNATEGAMEWT